MIELYEIFLGLVFMLIGFIFVILIELTVYYTGIMFKKIIGLFRSRKKF